MNCKMKSLLKLSTALALLFLAASATTAHAQTAGLWFANDGETPAQSAALTSIDVLTFTAEADGSVNFKVDIMYGDDVPDVNRVRFELHMDSSKLELVGTENVGSTLLSPVLSSLRQTTYADFASSIGPVPDDSDASTDTLIYPTWATLLSGPGNGIFGPATLTSPMRLLTLNLKWKAGAAGNTRLNFTADPDSVLEINTYDLTSLTIQGPPLAALTATPVSIQETGGDAQVIASCVLSRPALVKTTCMLAVQSGSTAVLTSDYTVAPAIAGATITIPIGDASATSTFTVTPVLAGDGGTIEIALSGVMASGAAVAWDMAKAILTILAPGLVFTPLRSTLKESQRHPVKMKLRTQQRMGRVVVNMSGSDKTEVSLSPAALTFEMDNWNVEQEVIVSTLDDPYDDGDMPFTVTFAVDNDLTNDDNYHDIIETISGENIDNDSTEISLSAVPAVLSESGGARDVVITAALTPGGPRLENDAAIDLRMGSGGTAVSGDDYDPFTLPSSVTIPAKSYSGSVTFTLTPKDDGAGDSDETIVLSATFALALTTYQIADLTLRIREFRLDATALSGDTGEDGDAATFELVLPSPPESGDVVVNVSSSDAGEASAAPAVLTFTATNWDTPQSVTVTGVDDNFDDGDVDYTVNLAVDDAATADANYDGLVQSVSGENIDDDTAMISISAAPAFLTEDAGAQNVVITATLEGGILLESDAEIMLGTGAGTATASDYTAFTPPNITISAEMASGAVNFAITTTTDSDDDSGETIILTPTFLPYTIANLILPIREFALKPSALSGKAGEDRSTAFFTLALPSKPSGDVVVKVSSSDTSEAVVSPAELVFTADNWDEARRVVVTGVDDSFDDGDKTYTVDLSVDTAQTADANYHGRTASLTGTNTDDDEAMVVLTASPSFLSEAGGAQSIVITARLSGGIRLGADTLITLGVGSGTATAGTDYTAFTPPNITIPAGEVSVGATFSITTTNDSEADNGETIVITAESPPHAIASLTFPIREFGLDVGAPSGQATEAGGAASIGVKLISAPASGAVVVRVSGGDAGEATVSPASLTFTAGNWNTRQPVRVTGVDDIFDDGDAGYAVTFAVDGDNTADSNYHGITESVPMVTIDNDEVVISLSVAPEFLVEDGATRGVIITATLDGTARLEANAEITLRDGGGTATVGDDYDAFMLPHTITISAGGNTGTVIFMIRPPADRKRDNGETIVFAATLPPYEIAAVTLPIREFDLYESALRGGAGENGATAAFDLALPNAPASGEVVVDVRGSDDTEVAVSPASLTFTAGNWGTLQTVTVAGIDDHFDDGDKPYTISLAVVNGKTDDSNYHDMSASVSGFNADDDDAVITLRADPAFLIEADGAQRVVVTAALSGDVRLEEQVVVALGVGGGGSAVAVDDYAEFAPPDITIPADTASAVSEFFVTPAPDDEDDNHETIAITGELALHDIADLLLPIREYALKVNASEIATSEAGGAATFELALPTAPSGEVVVNINSSAADEGAPSSPSVTFTPRDWQTPRRVVVTGVDDMFDDGNVSYTLGLAVDYEATADAGYHSRTASVAAVNADDDTAEIALAADPAFLVESGGAQQIVITAALGGDVRLESDAVIMLGAGSGTAVEGSGYEAFTPPRITILARAAAGSATFAVAPIDDDAAESGETIAITAAFPGYTIADLVMEILGFELDVDASGEITVHDGIMIARHLLGVEEDFVVALQSDEDAGTVVGNIEVGEMTRELDVNEDGVVDGDDGILITRYLLGLRGDVLEAGIDGADAVTVGGNIKKLLP